MKRCKNIFADMSVTWKFILAYYSIIIVPAIFLGIYLYSQTTNTVITQAQMVMEQNLAQTRASILQNVKIIENISQIVAFSPKIQSFLDTRFNNEPYQIENYKYDIVPFVENIMRQNRIIQSMRIFMSDSSIPELYDSFYSLNRVKEEQWFKDIWNDKSIKSIWRSSHTARNNRSLSGIMDNTQVFSYYCKIIPTNFSGQAGILEIDIKEEVLFDMLRDNVIKELGNEFIIDNQGTIVSNNIPDLFGKKVEYAGVNGVTSSSYFNKVKTVDGVTSIVISVPIKEIGCSIVGIFPTAHFNKKATNTIVAIIFVIAASSILIGIFIFIATNALLIRVRKLAKAMRQVREGNLDITLPVYSKDEFGDLTVSFNHMTARIHDLIETVYKIQIMEREAELKALEAQINPHFLYNTLAAVAWSGRIANAPDVVNITNSLAKFYRLVLNKGNTMIPVSEELEMVKAYLYIQKIRFVDSFDVLYDVDERVYQYYTMKNMLQPVVENALNHGIQPKRSHGTIILKVQEDGNNLVFRIIDDGVGMESGTLREVMESKVERSRESGYAVKNVMERLKAYYGDSSSFDIFSRRGIGTVVTIIVEKKFK